MILHRTVYDMIYRVKCLQYNNGILHTHIFSYRIPLPYSRVILFNTGCSLLYFSCDLCY